MSNDLSNLPPTGFVQLVRREDLEEPVPPEAPEGVLDPQVFANQKPLFIAVVVAGGVFCCALGVLMAVLMVAS